MSGSRTRSSRSESIWSRSVIDAGPHTIVFHLQRRHGSGPSPSTIWRVLTRRGFVVPEPTSDRRSSYVRFEADQPNERWQLDITHWRLADGSDVEILNIIDDHSRLVVGCDARRVFKAADVRRLLPQSRRHLGGSRPDAVRQRRRVHRRHRGRRPRRARTRAHQRSASTFRHSRPYHPQTCGKVERFHQTLKNWLATRPPTSSIRLLQVQLDRFVRLLQHGTTPLALSRRTPAEAYQARPKATRFPRRSSTSTSGFAATVSTKSSSPCDTTADSTTSPWTTTQRPTRPRAHPRPRRARPHRNRRTDPSPHPGPHPQLPAAPTIVNDVPRQLRTMSRDIAVAPPAGFEPATRGLEGLQH